MDELTEEQFVERYEKDYAARHVARDLYRAMHPVGMHTNGPTIVRVEASLLARVLSRWQPISASVEQT